MFVQFTFLFLWIFKETEETEINRIHLNIVFDLEEFVVYAWTSINASKGNWRTCLQSHLQTSPPTPQKIYEKFWYPSITIKNSKADKVIQDHMGESFSFFIFK